MTDSIRYFQEVTKSNIGRIFNAVLPNVVEPFQEQLISYLDGTIAYIEQLLLYEERMKLLNDLTNEWRFRKCEEIAKDFVRTIVDINNTYKSTWEEIDRVLLDNMIVLRRDPQLDSLIREYANAEKSHFHRHHLFCMIPGVGCTILTNSPPLGILATKPFVSIKYRLDNARHKVYNAVQEAAKQINNQEAFLQERIKQQQQQTNQNLVLLSPGYSSGDLDILQSMKTEREKLLRTLQSL